MTNTTTEQQPSEVRAAKPGPPPAIEATPDEVAVLDPATAALLEEEAKAIKADLRRGEDLSVEEVRSLEARVDDLCSRAGQAAGLPAGLTCEQIMARVVVR